MAAGLCSIVIALWFIGSPAHSVNLRHVAGVVEDATDTKHHKEPSGTSSFALVVKGSDGKSVPLRVVKRHVKADALRALVGHRVSALHHRGLIHELRSEQGILFTFNKAVPIAAPEGLALYWSGIASLDGGPALALGSIRETSSSVSSQLLELSTRGEIAGTTRHYLAKSATVHVIPTFQEK